MHLQTVYSKHIFFHTEIVYKPITLRIDEYLIVRKHREGVLKRMNECRRAPVCVHLLKHTQTKHVTHNTVHGNEH